MRIALAQLATDWEAKEINMHKAFLLVRRAAREGAELIVFPEMTLTGFSMDIGKIAENHRNAPTVAFFCSLAREHHAAILFGVVFTHGGKGKNSAVMVDFNGNVVGVYEKRHLFSPAGEDHVMVPGNHFLRVSFQGFTVMPIICYDLRFLESMAKLVSWKPDVMIVLASWPKARIHHWTTLLQARALDLQSYVIGVNRVGRGKQIPYNGQSIAIAADGSVLRRSGVVALSYVDIDLQKLKQYRKEFPFRNDV